MLGSKARLIYNFQFLWILNFTNNIMTKTINKIKLAVLTIFVSIVFLPLSANEKDINALMVMLECYNSGGISYNEVAENIMNEETQTSTLKYIQHTLFLNPNMYHEMSLNWKDGNLVSGIYKSDRNTSKIMITRQNGRIHTIHIDAGGWEKHRLEYNEQGQIVKLWQEHKLGSETQRYYEVKYNDDNKISYISLTLSNVKKNKSAPFHEKTFIYNTNNCETRYVMYNGIETRKLKKKLNKIETGSFLEFPEERKYITVCKNETDASVWTTETTYNADNQRIYLLDTNVNKNRTAVNKMTYEYSNGVETKEITLNSVDGKFGYRREIFKHKLDASTNQYIPMQDGDIISRNYDESGEPIFEVKKEAHPQYREKKDGVWTPWAYMRI